ncbi:MAG: dienelactone hydrolase family protein [Thermoanaerobaculia bacterium]
MPDESEVESNVVRVDARGVQLEGNLALPVDADGVVLFAHGSGSSRHSPRNRQVAEVLNRAGVGTLLIDLLTADEESVDNRTAQLRFDIRLLAERLIGATEWLRDLPETKEMSIGYFGASTGGGAALVASSNRKDIAAIVSRGGRPDLAGQALPFVEAPTLLIVGGLDGPVIEMNREAYELLQCEKRMEIVPGATHLFEEEGKLERVAELARDWFTGHFC